LPKSKNLLLWKKKKLSKRKSKPELPWKNNRKKLKNKPKSNPMKSIT
jgi:hypothetical protein